MHNVEPMPTSDAAAELGVDVRTLHRWVAAGKITALFKTPGLRGAYMFDPAEVRRVKDEQAAA